MPGKPVLSLAAPHNPGRNITAVAITFRMGRAIFLPQHHQVDARPLQLAGQRRPIRLRTATQAALHAGAGEQPVFEHIVGQFGRQWPSKPRRFGPLQIVLDRAARDAEHSPNLARTDAVADQPQYLSYLPHGQLSLRRHQVLLVDDHEGPDAQVADPRKNAEGCQPSGRRLIGTRPTSVRNGGRLQIGTMAGIKSEYPAGLRRNPHCETGAANLRKLLGQPEPVAARIYVAALPWMSTCTRCQRKSDRLIRRRLCISCYNRDREARLGRNAKGSRPGLCDELHLLVIAVVEAGQVRRVRQDLATGALEVMLGVIKEASGPVVFGWGKGHE